MDSEKKICGKKELNSTSNSHVLAKSLSLIEGKAANKNICQMEKTSIESLSQLYIQSQSNLNFQF